LNAQRAQRPSRHASFRLLRVLGGKFLDIFLWFGHVLTPSNSLLLEEIPQINSEKIAIFARFGNEDASENNLINLLQRLGFETFIIENTSNISRNHVWGHHKVFYRQNKGFDFGAYRDILCYTEKASKLLLINSSVHWDVDRLEAILRRLQLKPLENSITYLTESLQGHRHGQSFFMYLQIDSTNLAHFKRLMKRNIRNWTIKRMAVTYGEKKIGNLLRSKLHLTSIFLYPYPEVWENYLNLPIDNQEIWISNLIKKGINLNPTHHLWPALLVLGFPGYKKSLINDNPAGLRSLPEVGGI